MKMKIGTHVLINDCNEYDIKQNKRGVIVSIRPDSPYPYLVCIDRMWLNFRATDVKGAPDKLTWLNHLFWQCKDCHERCKLLDR